MTHVDPTFSRGRSGGSSGSGQGDGTDQRGSKDNEPFLDAHPNPGSPPINEKANKLGLDPHLPNSEYQDERNNQLFYTYDGAGDPPPIFDDPGGEKDGMD